MLRMMEEARYCLAYKKGLFIRESDLKIHNDWQLYYFSTSDTTFFRRSRPLRQNAYYLPEKLRKPVTWMGTSARCLLVRIRNHASRHTSIFCPGIWSRYNSITNCWLLTLDTSHWRACLEWFTAEKPTRLCRGSLFAWRSGKDMDCTTQCLVRRKMAEQCNAGSGDTGRKGVPRQVEFCSHGNQRERFPRPYCRD
jgi:hypothetical protein